MRRLIIPIFLMLLASCKENFQSSVAYDRGKEVYIANCISCHGANGSGNLIYPALKSREINEMALQRTVNIMVNGSVNMPKVDLTDNEMTDVINFIQNSWGMETNPISKDSVETLKSLYTNAEVHSYH